MSPTPETVHLSIHQRPALEAGLAAIDRFLERSRQAGLERLPHRDLLLVRSADGLSYRLHAVAEADFALDGSLISAADLGVLDDLAMLLPDDRGAFLGVRNLLADAV